MKPSLILHPVSYSPSGKSALAQALALARLYQADLHILEVRGRRVFSNDPIIRPFSHGGVEPHLAEFVEPVGSTGARVSVVELAGDAVAAVVDYARQASADLVVVAANARSHGPYWRPGAYANDLARHLSCPVLSVPVPRGGDALPSGPPFTNILGATDLSDASATVVEQASSLAHQTGAALAFVQGVTSQSIIGTASNNGSDLIVIGRQDRSATNHVIMNSTTAKVLREARCSVLVLPAQRTEGALIASESTAALTEPAFAHR